MWGRSRDMTAMLCVALSAIILVSCGDASEASAPTTTSSATATVPTTTMAPTTQTANGDLTITVPPLAAERPGSASRSGTSSSSGSISSATTDTAPTTTAPTETSTAARQTSPPATATSKARATGTAAKTTKTTRPAKTTEPAKAAKTTTAPHTAKAATTKPTTKAAKTTKAPKTNAAPTFGIPVSTGNARQIITVVAPSHSSTTATLTAWQRAKDGSWHTQFGPVTAWVGSGGIGKASEGSTRTPQGTFTLTEAFGAKADPGSGLPYRVTTANDWWVSDVNAPTYNTWQTCRASACPFSTAVSEHLHAITPYYNYAVVMDYNRSPVVPGAGSAFFLHVTVHKPTAGCVAIEQKSLVAIMRWLDPAAHPRIATGIG